MEMTADMFTEDLILFEGLFQCKEWETADMFGGVTFFNCTMLKDLYPFEIGDVVDTIRWNFGNHTLTFVKGVTSVLYNVSFKIGKC